MLRIPATLLFASLIIPIQPINDSNARTIRQPLPQWGSSCGVFKVSFQACSSVPQRILTFLTFDVSRLWVKLGLITADASYTIEAGKSRAAGWSPGMGKLARNPCHGPHIDELGRPILIEHDIRSVDIIRHEAQGVRMPDTYPEYHSSLL